MTGGEGNAPPDRRAAPDEALASQAAAGDHEAFAVLVERYQEAVYLYCLRSAGDHWDAVELTNETFYRAWRALPRYDPSRPWRPWLFRIAVNVCRSYRRTWVARRSRETPFLEPGLPVADVEDPLQQPEDAAFRQVEVARIREAFRTLPPRLREAALLYYGVGLSYQEIGAALCAPAGTVATWLHRAREHLRLALQERGGTGASTHQRAARATAPERGHKG